MTKEWAQIAALLAVPIVLATVANRSESQSKAEELNYKYVELSINLLANENTDTNLKEWASKVVSKASQVPLPELSAKDAETLQKEFSSLQYNLRIPYPGSKFEVLNGWVYPAGATPTREEWERQVKERLSKPTD